jgi:hypothetical protein
MGLKLILHAVSHPDLQREAVFQTSHYVIEVAKIMAPLCRCSFIFLELYGASITRLKAYLQALALIDL